MNQYTEALQLANPPSVPGLVFRHFRGEADYPAMVRVVNDSSDADGIERRDSVEQMANFYVHLTNCNPYEDMIMAEINGELVGYGRATWWEELDGPIVNFSIGFIVPWARRKGIGGAMLRWLEERHHHFAAQHPPEREKTHNLFVETSAVGTVALAQSAGYKPRRYFHEMVRPSLDDLPDSPLPDGVELRRVTPDHYRAIWDAHQEAFRDHWGFAEPEEADYQQWLSDPILFQPDLWQIAWDIETDEIAGQVRTFINHGENEKYNRQRGYTEFISVRRPWRRQGLASALIARSLQLQKELGMTESALGVDSENISGATRIYEACGFRTVKTNASYSKPLVPRSAA